MKDLESQSELCVFNVTKKDRIHRGGGTIQRTEQENDLANSGKVVCWCWKKGHGWLE